MPQHAFKHTLSCHLYGHSLPRDAYRHILPRYLCRHILPCYPCRYSVQTYLAYRSVQTHFALILVQTYPFVLVKRFFHHRYISILATFYLAQTIFLSVLHTLLIHLSKRPHNGRSASLPCGLQKKVAENDPGCIKVGRINLLLWIYLLIR